MKNHIATKECASFLMEVDHSVMVGNQVKIRDEELFRKDGEINQYLTVKTPWYNEDNKIIGIFGCSIDIGKHSLPESLSLMSELGLLSNQSVSHEGTVYLSKQQLACSKLLVSGYKIKEIALQLQLSPRTVENYIDNVKYKLNCKNKTELIVRLSKLLALP